MSIFKRANPAIAAVAAVAVIAALVWVLLPHTGKRYLTADFPNTISLYQGSDVRILGVSVGKVESITPMGTYVRVRMSYSDSYPVPADAKAVVISPSIVGDRFVQLTPAYKGTGPTLPDNAELGINRTATPLELDQIFGSLNTLDVALGPEGANAPGANGVGALTRLLDSTAANFGGQGIQFNQSIQNLAKLTKTLSDNKDNLFQTSAQVEKFVRALADNDTTVRHFAQSLASGSSMLAGDRTALASALDNLAVALTQVRGFVHDNRALLTSNIAGLTRISDTIVQDRASLDQTLKDAPVALNNLGLAYDPQAGSLDTRADFGQSVTELTSNPSVLACTLLGPVFNLLHQGCPSGSLRPAPFTNGKSTTTTYTNFDPTLAGILGGTR